MAALGTRAIGHTQLVRQASGVTRHSADVRFEGVSSEYHPERHHPAMATPTTSYLMRMRPRVN
jgi:hypothetical protein